MDKDTCILLIRQYQNHRILWDQSHKHYFDKPQRDDAWQDISLKIRIPVDEIKKKMTSLSGSYRRERSRQKRSCSSGRKKAYKSKWFAYDLFSFLSKKWPSPSTIRKTTTTEPALENSDSPEISISPIPRHQSGACKRKAADAVEDGIPLKETLQESLYADDAYVTFGKHVAAELRKYDSLKLIHVKRAIMYEIFKADTEMVSTSSTDMRFVYAADSPRPDALLYSSSEEDGPSAPPTPHINAYAT